MKGKKILIGLIVAMLFLTSCGPSESSIEEYKSDATKITWIELADGDISGSTKVTFDGIAGESSEDGETLVVSDSDGVYYVRVPDDLEFEIEEGDEIIIWGTYVGDDKKTGFPKIDTKIIEQK